MELYARTDTSSHSGLKILIAEDDMTHFMHLSSLLRKRGYYVKVVNNGKDALHMLQTEPFHAFFLDLMLPKVDGFEVIEKLQETPELQKTPVIITSAHIMRNFMHRFPQDSVKGFLPKPIDPSVLDGALRKVEGHAPISS